MSRKAPLRREVMAAHDKWAAASQRYGDNDLETVRRSADYHELRREWEEANGRGFWDKPRRRN